MVFKYTGKPYKGINEVAKSLQFAKANECTMICNSEFSIVIIIICHCAIIITKINNSGVLYILAGDSTHITHNRRK